MKVLCAIGIILWMSTSAYGVETYCEWKDPTVRYTCVLRNAFTKAAGDSITTSNHLNSLGNIDVKRVEVPGLASSFIIRQITTTFTRLEDLIIENGTVESLAANSETFVNSGVTTAIPLVNLKISRGKIPSIPQQAFHLCNSLVVLDLSKNEIITIDSSADVGLQKLEVLILDDNKIPTGSSLFQFTRLTMLKTLSIAGNGLGSLPTALPSKTTLRKIDLSRNLLTTITDNYFSGYTALEELLLDQNKIKTLNNDFFNALNVKILNIATNEFQAFEFLRKATILESLNIASQTPKITALNATMLDENKNLKNFNASHNEIKSLYNTLFVNNAEKILNLDMRSNRIEIVDRDFISKLKNVNATFFSCNKCISKDFYPTKATDKDFEVCKSSSIIISTALVSIAVALVKLF